MSVADILRGCGIVPIVPTTSPRVGTLQTLVASHVPTVPTEKHKARAQPLKSAPVLHGELCRMRAELLALADRLGMGRAAVVRIPSADLADYAGLRDDQLTACLHMLADAADRKAGKVPEGDTAAMHCVHCGPVWIHADIASVLPVVGGWPRALGCPWCFVRRAGGSVPAAIRPTSRA